MNEDRKTVTFLYHGEIMIFQFAIEENIFERFSKEINKDISNMCFLYNGNIIKEDFDISNIKNEIKILICDFEFEREEKESLKLSKEIICPICQELCEINFSNYKSIIKLELSSSIKLLIICLKLLRIHQKNGVRSLILF